MDDADRVFVTCTDAGELVVLDLATLTEINRVGDLTRPDAVTLGTDGTVYVGLQRGPATPVRVQGFACRSRLAVPCHP